jgi:peptide/nickel transport system permease protein
VLRYLTRRSLLLVPTLWGITLVTFLLIHLAPGDPAAAQLDGGSLSRSALLEFRRTMGLDLPLHRQYANWIGRLVHLDFGRSLHDGRPVLAKIAEALPHTALLAGLALLLIVLVAVPLGIHGATHPDSRAERAGQGALFAMHALPSFFVALLLIELLCGGSRFGVDLFPMQGLGGPLHLVLPVFCLAYGSWATVARQVRGSLSEALAQDHIRTARAMGLSERRVVLVHGLRNALLPAVTVLGVLVPNLLGGSVIVESIFGIPGIGLLGFQAVTGRDYNTLMGVATVVALVTLLANLAADLLCAAIDPRTAHGA